MKNKNVYDSQSIFFSRSLTALTPHPPRPRSELFTCLRLNASISIPHGGGCPNLVDIHLVTRSASVNYRCFIPPWKQPEECRTKERGASLIYCHKDTERAGKDKEGRGDGLPFSPPNPGTRGRRVGGLNGFTTSHAMGHYSSGKWQKASVWMGKGNRVQ